ALKLSASTLTHITMNELFCQHFFQYFLNIFRGQIEEKPQQLVYTTPPDPFPSRRNLIFFLWMDL
ncbi:hypothetical protein, partial [Dubosiella newyorkensis]|uniref:hypothetical protein n=1 Tax=Dubosiella newyorkensis TaxID=1862672 RepID=UPI00272C9FD0